jgi:hypothetical protein
MLGIEFLTDPQDNLMSQGTEIKDNNPALFRQLFELHKHITTLNTASLLILASFTSKSLFWEKFPRSLFFTFLPLISSLAASLVCMYLIVYAQHFETRHDRISPSSIAGVISGFALVSFLVGMASLAFVAIKSIGF